MGDLNTERVRNGCGPAGKTTHLGVIALGFGLVNVSEFWAFMSRWGILVAGC